MIQQLKKSIIIQKNNTISGILNPQTIKMQSRSSTDQRWISYIVIIFAYTLAVINDWISAILFIFILLQFVGLLSRGWMFFLAEIVFIGDFVIKSPFIGIDAQKFLLDKTCVQYLFDGVIKPQIFLYVAAHLYNLYLCILYFINRNTRVRIKTWGPLMTQIMVYTLPILIYILSLISDNWTLKIVWAVLACLQMLDFVPKLNHFLICVMITFFFFGHWISPQYIIQVGERKFSQNIVIVILVLIVLLLNVYSNPHQKYKQNPTKTKQDNKDLSSSERKITKRQAEYQQQKQKLQSVIVLSLASVLCLVTTSLGNVFIILGLYSNIPVFKAKRFFSLLGFGILISVMLQPQQIPYFLYLYIIVLIVGQDITSQNVIPYEMHSYSFFLNFYRLYIMLSHVSFLNWILGIFSQSIIVTIALGIRIFCRYFNYVSVFLGTNDHYGFDMNFFDLHSFSDSVLIVFLILLRLYNPEKTKTYQSSNVTNILLQYPLLSKCNKLFIIFRVFNWISYILFSLIILSRRPSLYITIHIFFLVLVLICDTIKNQQFSRKNWVIKHLWNLNFYATTIMIFTKYFYFLKQYQSNSDLMNYLLQILTQYKFWLGLDDLSKQTEGLALGQYFIYEGMVIILSWINIYVYSFKCYYQSKYTSANSIDQIEKDIVDGLQIVLSYEQQKQDVQKKEQKYDFISSKYLKQMKEQENRLKKKKSYEEQLTKAKYENIHYFYYRFIRPVDLKTYLAHHQYKIAQKILRDCLLDVFFLIIVLAFQMEQQRVQYIFYFPHFMISTYAYYVRFRKGPTLQFTQKILGLCTGWSFMMLFGSYLYITFLQMYDEQIPTALVKVYITYILCILICILYKICCCLPSRDPNEKTYHCLIYLFFPFKVQSNKLWTEMLSIMSEFWLTLTMSLFFTNIFSPRPISAILHPIAIGFLLTKRVGKQKSQYWLYIVCIVSIFDIWNYDFFAYFTVLSTTIFYAVKTAQKMSQQKIQSKQYQQERDSDYVSEIDFEDGQLSPADSQQKKWSYYIAYCTMVWMLPQFLSLIWMFGVVWLSPSIIATVLIAFSYGTLLYQLLFQKSTQISQPLMIVTLAITGIFFSYQLYSYTSGYLFQNYTSYNHSEMGLFLIFQSCFFYLTLRKRSIWYDKRANDAKAYWDLKREIVGQLGSQLHNEKKLITLEKYYSSKQRLTQRVNKISDHLKHNGRKAYFQSLDNIVKVNQQSQKSYQLYTNMLIFLDMQILRKCFLMLNQYITASKQQNVVVKAKGVRDQIYRTYQRSFNQAFSRYKNQQQNLDENIKQQSIRLSKSISRSSTVNLEKINEINQRYKKCFQLISKNTEQFNRFFRFVIQNFQIISMMIVIGWNLFGGVYTIPTNILIFGWAVVLENKTTVTFWVLVMSYTCFVLIFKQIIPYFSGFFLVDFIFYYHPQDYLYEFLIVLVSVIQITLIKLGGTRHKTYSERQTIYDAFYRAALNKAANGSELDKQQDFMDIYKNLAEPQKHSFWYRVFSKSRFKPGKDFYPLMSSIQLIILLYIFFFYDMMEFQSRKNRKSIGELLTINQFSSHMVIALFLQIVIMILDRFIISLNLVDEDNQILENFFLSFTFSLTQVKKAPPQKLDKVGIFDFLLVLKYLFHLSLLFMINFFVYFYIPSAGLTKSLIPTCNGEECHQSYTYLSIFLILYFSYFLVSGLQIKHGFNRNKCKNVLMQKFHYTNYYTYKMFTAIPFAWQFKKICDWTVTSTALPLFHWMKFQDINARLYESKCQAQMIRIKPLGTPWNKYFLGPSGFLIILLFAFSPFILYSSVNPFAVTDAVIGARTDIYLRMNDRYDYKFFSTSHAIITEKSQENFELQLTNQNLYEIKMSKYPDENFLLSQPLVKELSRRIKAGIVNKSYKFAFILNLNTIQQEGGQSTIEWTKKDLSPSQLQDLYNLLTLTQQKLSIQKFYSPFPGQLPLESITIYSPNGGQYFEVELYRKSSINKQLYFYYLTSNKYKISVGILTFYITYILVISRLLRFYLTGTVRNILYQGCYLESILVLCQAVREARIVENFIQEESFYFQLMDIMRQPKAIKQITGDFLSFRKKHI